MGEAHLNPRIFNYCGDLITLVRNLQAYRATGAALLMPWVRLTSRHDLFVLEIEGYVGAWCPMLQARNSNISEIEGVGNAKLGFC